MTHEDALNKILSRSCANPAYYPDDGITREYEIIMCCDSLLVIAQSMGDMKFNIIDVKEIE